jgi:putative FmdB family regulatory protein
MPIYEYSCENCGNSFEKLVRRAGTDVACPKCSSHDLQQQYSTFAARANGITREAASPGGCPAGMCATPGLCGRN